MAERGSWTPGRGDQVVVRAGAAHGDATLRSLPVRVPAPREQAAALTLVQPLTEYRALQQWCEQARARLGGSDLGVQEVLHVLVLRLLADPQLTADVTADLREGACADEVAAYAVW